jgi:hypothetical protein
MIERILCAAIRTPDWYDMAGHPMIHCGFRHNMILWQDDRITRTLCHQGFLTSRGRFVDRREAAIIAINAGQIVKCEFVDDELFSEDLY